jgi:hypothetical protein
MPDCTDPRPHRGDYELDCGCLDRGTGSRWALSEAYLDRLAELQKRSSNVIDLARCRRSCDQDRGNKQSSPPEADRGALTAL